MIETMCTLCGTRITAKTTTKKYCDDCRLDVSRKHGKMGADEAIRRNGWDTHESGRRQTKDGYVLIRDKNGNWKAEHRVLMEQKMGRPLIPKIESVHHINGIRNDNRLENLELWLGAIRYGQRATDVKCHNCGEAYKV